MFQKTQVFTGQTSFLSPIRHCQSPEGNTKHWFPTSCLASFFIQHWTPERSGVTPFTSVLRHILKKFVKFICYLPHDVVCNSLCPLAGFKTSGHVWPIRGCWKTCFCTTEWSGGVLHSFRRDVLSSVPAAAQTTQMSLQQVFALLSGTQVSHLSNNYLCTTLNIHTIDMPDSG